MGITPSLPFRDSPKLAPSFSTDQEMKHTDEGSRKGARRASEQNSEEECAARNKPATDSGYAIDDRSMTDHDEQSVSDLSETLTANPRDVAPREEANPIISPSPFPETVTIQAGTRRFTANRSTLTEGSLYFRALFSGRWTPRPQPDGSYLVDVDGNHFTYLLMFMQHGWLPRAVFTVEAGRRGFVDREFYDGLKDAAAYLRVDELYEWLKDERFLDAGED